MLKVNEIFYSLQGESSFAGLPCVFIRLTGCNLRCSYCDTRYAYESGTEYTVAEILKRISLIKCRLVEITGGEPLIQEETPIMISGLLELGYKVLLETNGSLDIGKIDSRCSRIVDFKCPSSGESDKNCLENLSSLTGNDEVKFVIGNREDYEYATSLVSILANNCRNLKLPFLSPVFGKMDMRILAEWMLEDNLQARLQVQLHKIIWSAEARGV